MNNFLFSGVTVEDVLKDSSLDITEENLLKVKYEPRSVWGYVEVRFITPENKPSLPFWLSSLKLAITLSYICYHSLIALKSDSMFSNITNI